MAFTGKQLREVFHFVFLENLLRLSDPKLFVLKGGVNLRFLFKSPRYSEDLDIDVIGGSVETLRKNVYKILKDAAFRRALKTYGIVDLKINDPLKAKQTETTQRFRLRLINEAGEEFPTKVEFSRRKSEDVYLMKEINPEIAFQYKRISFRFQHYEGTTAVRQKIRALAGRSETQARDVFDLYLLYLSGQWPATLKLSKSMLGKAKENLLSISFHQYGDQVIEFLSDEGRLQFGAKEYWNAIQEKILEKLS